MAVLFFSSLFAGTSHFYLFARKINDLTLDLANEKRQSVFVARFAGAHRKRETVIFYTLQRGHIYHVALLAESALACAAYQITMHHSRASLAANELCALSSKFNQFARVSASAPLYPLVGLVGWN